MKTVYIMLSFCAGLLLGYLLFPTGKEINPHTYVQLEQVKENIAKVDSSLTSGNETYQQKTDSLTKELKGYKFLLAEARTELAQKRKGTANLLQKMKNDSSAPCDPLLLDSLSSQIALVNQSTDSLILRYEQKDSITGQLLATKDAQILICNNAYQQLRDLAQEGILREQQLTESLNTALKVQKRKRVQSRLLAAGLVFVSGITTTLYIKSKQ
ncbi:MAG: hypothetical protein ACJ77K_06395 [Bacteroidia bacterium]